MFNKRVGWLIYLLAGFAAAWLMLKQHRPVQFQIPQFSLENQTPQPAHGKPLMQSEFISGGLTQEVHSATAVKLPNGDIGVFWYAGTREGSSDVAIFSRFLHRQNSENKPDSWSDIRQVIDRTGSMDGVHRYIRKVGNPLALYYQDKLWLFYVTVSLGGWAGSAVNFIQSSDSGKTWSKPQRLISSPFLNISTLVKERAVIAADGSILLPVYHEFIGKFAEILRIDTQGKVIDKFRISHGRQAIQPILLPQSRDRAIVFLRNVSEHGTHRILTSQSIDGVEHWQPLSDLSLPNPDAAVSSVSLDKPNELLLVFNNDEKERSDLTLAYSPEYEPDKPQRWQIIYEFENAARGEHLKQEEHNPYSYPFLIKTLDGHFHLFYSWKRQYIKHVYFNRAALDSMIADRPIDTHPFDQEVR